MDRFARFIKTLDEMKEPGGTSALDIPMIVYSGDIGNANLHNHDELAEPTPMTNLCTAVLDRIGVEVESVGDTTGRLEDI